MIIKKIGVYALLFAMACQPQNLSKVKEEPEQAQQAEKGEPDKLSLARPLRYKPEGTDFVIVNGTRRFNRALYGTHSAFRVEAGDLPEFLMYMPRKGGNLKLGIGTAEGDKWLIDAAHIKAVYRPGTMLYEITDPLLEGGQLNLQVWAMAESEGMLLEIEAAEGTEPFNLIWTYGGASGHRPSRDGDIGADPEEGFYLHPEHAKENKFTIEGNTFLLDYKQKSEDSQILGVVPPASSIKVADARQQQSPETLVNSGASELPVVSGSIAVEGGRKMYFGLQNSKSTGPRTYEELPAAIDSAESKRKKMAGQVKIETPDPYLNTLGGALSIAADAIWDSPNYMHGAIAWRMPLNGWRGAYVADALGWHDRARTHFTAYSKVQVLEPDSGPVVPDPEKNLARQKEEIGVSLFTEGYISRSPTNSIRAHHYDMNMVFIDQMLRHFQWTGDTVYAREAWPVLERHLAWEKRNFDADNDGLYDAYCSFWASDAVQYSGGGVTHSSAYHYFSNKTAAKLAELIGKDPAPYRAEAERIHKAINETLWMPEKGWYAEFQDLLGNRKKHTSAALWTIYHTLDSEVPDPFQAYQALRYVDTQIPRIPVKAAELPDEDFYTLTTTNWMPYTWSVNNVALAEVAHTALAYWQAGRPEEANQLMKSMLIESMFMGPSPGNLQQLSYYDHYRGNLYRDFADGIGISSRAIVEGMFGILPDLISGELVIRPGLPADWERASFETPDILYAFRREGDTEKFTIEPRFGKPLKLKFRAPALGEKVVSVSVNGKKADWHNLTDIVGKPQIEIIPPVADKYKVEIQWGGNELSTAKNAAVAATGSELQLDMGNAKVSEVKDPQNIIAGFTNENNRLNVKVKGAEGHHTFFVLTEQGDLKWWQPVNVEVREPYKLLTVNQASAGYNQLIFENNTAERISKEVVLKSGSFSKTIRLNAEAFGRSAAIAIPAADLQAGTNMVQISDGDKVLAKGELVNWSLPLSINQGKLEQVDLSSRFNDNVTRIFQNEYLSPRPAVATVQLPKQGIGNWCYPLVTAEIDDSGLRAKAGDRGLLALPNGLQFKTPATGKNILFTSQWDNYPDEASVPLNGRASHAYLLMAGSTNPMQSRFENGEVLVNYTDGTQERLELRNPETWWPIEQDYYINDYSFSVNRPKPLRVELKSGNLISEGFKYSSIKGFAYDSYIPGGAATVLDLPLDPARELQSLEVKALANDVVIGLMGVSLVRN